MGPIGRCTMRKRRATSLTTASTFKIERGVPLPPRGTQSAYPFSEMKVGDSFLVPLDGRKAVNIQHALWFSAKRKGVHILTRSDSQGVRVWRVK